MIHRSIALLSLFFLASFSTTLPSQLEDDILNHTNALRRTKGLSELVLNEELSELARKHSADMASGKTRFGHAGFEKRSVKASKVISGYTAMAENVAYGNYSAKEVVDEWKRSKGHRQNMLGKFRFIGIGTAKSKNGILYFTQIFVR